MKTINNINTVNETVNNKNTNTVLNQEVEQNIISVSDIINMDPEEIKGYSNFTELGELLNVSKTATSLINKLDYENSKKTPTEKKDLKNTTDELLRMFGIPKESNIHKSFIIQDAMNGAFQVNAEEYADNLVAV